MDLVLTGGKNYSSMDDNIIYIITLEDERKYDLLIERLREVDLKLQSDKCEFLKSEVIYLRHIISKNGVKPDPKKLESMRQFSTPKTSKNIK